MNRAAKNAYAKAGVQIFGAYPESFINMAVTNGIELWNLKRADDNTLLFDTYESCEASLKMLAEKCCVELELIRYRDKSRKIFKNRYLLLILCLGLGLCLFVSSLFIWRIEIHGNERLSRGEILRALEDSGVYVGRFWPGIRADPVRSSFIPALEDVAWMTVNINGSRAVVLINERMPKPEIYEESDAADLVAAKTGLVRRVSVLNGNEAVEAGQAVTTGEILVNGHLGSIMGNERRVRARGTVMADVWYEIDSVCPEEMALKTSAGVPRHRFALAFGKRRINLYISSGKAIDECDKIIKDKTVGLEGHFALPIRFIHETIVPYETETGNAYDMEAMGRFLLSWLLGQTEGQILQSSFTESNCHGLYVLTLRAHCVENIAQTQQIVS